MAAAAFQAAGIPHALINVPAGEAVPQRDDSLEHMLTEELPYNVTIYCMSAFDMAVLYLARGPEFFAEQYRIGYWPWELPGFPPVWKDVYTLVDEVWAGSTFTAHSHRTQCTKPVRRLPCPVVLPPVEPVPRRDLGLHDESAFVFVYPFDINSHLARKNPLGLVRAFRLAFPATDMRVALLLRVNGNADTQSGWATLAAECAADRRISILAGTLDRQTALGVMASADCLVSPHRAEGFGRNIAEAILLGIPVLATAFSGCTDFLAPEEGLPFEPTLLRDGDYPFGEGLWWAEPSVPEMARRMRQVRRAVEKDCSGHCQRLARRRAEVAAAYSPLAAGKAFATRLRQIKRQIARPRSASSLRWGVRESRNYVLSGRGRRVKCVLLRKRVRQSSQGTHPDVVTGVSRPRWRVAMNERFVALLDRLAGQGEGQRLFQQLLDSNDAVEQVVRSIAGSAAFEYLYKEARTRDVVHEGRKEADAAFVGLPELAAAMPFEEQFHRHFKPRLGKRADGFAILFDTLPRPRQDLLVLETGCIRIPGNWEGDGQSTFMIDALVRERHGLFFSIDIDLESIDTARRACSSATHLICNDSIAALHALSQALRMKASLLYLDSYDVDAANPMPSAIHHALELAAASPLIGPGTIVCVDDYGIGPEGGKGMILDRFFSTIRAEEIHCGYQKVWRVM